MLRHWLRFFTPLVLLLAFAVPAVHAQAPAAEGEKAEKSTSAVPYVVTILYALIVLSIVCMPSRKA